MVGKDFVLIEGEHCLGDEFDLTNFSMFHVELHVLRPGKLGVVHLLSKVGKS